MSYNHATFDGEPSRWHIMPAKLPSFLMLSRHGIYYLRITRNGVESRRSLGTRDPLTARTEAYQFGATLLAMKNPNKRNQRDWTLNVSADGAYSINTQDNDEDRAAAESLALKIRQDNAYLRDSPPDSVLAAFIARMSEPEKKSITLRDAMNKYFNGRKDQIDGATAGSYKTHINAVLNYFGEESELHEITTEAMTNMLNQLATTRAPVTIKSYCTTLINFWEWLKDHNYATENPVVRPKLGKKIKAKLTKERSHPSIKWSGEDLLKIFNTKNLDAYSWPEDPWMPLLGLYTGARAEAIARLKIEDFKEYSDGNWSVYFDEEFDKLGRERDIPIHPILISAGLIDYIADVKSLHLADTSIFPTQNIVGGRKAKGHGRRFTEQREALMVQKGSHFHALRTTLISVLALNHSPLNSRRAFVGHATDETLDVEEKHYNQSFYGPELLAAEIFPYLNYESIGYAWCGWKYTAGSAIPKINKILRRQYGAKLQSKRKASKEPSL